MNWLLELTPMNPDTFESESESTLTIFFFGLEQPYNGPNHRLRSEAPVRRSRCFVPLARCKTRDVSKTTPCSLFSALMHYISAFSAWILVLIFINKAPSLQWVSQSALIRNNLLQNILGGSRLLSRHAGKNRRCESSDTVGSSYVLFCFWCSSCLKLSKSIVRFWTEPKGGFVNLKHTLSWWLFHPRNTIFTRN